MTGRRQNRLVGALLLAALLIPSLASAHPLGNNTITHFSVLRVLPEQLEVDLLLDIAEIPAANIRREEIDADRDGTDTVEEQKAWLERKAVEWGRLLQASIDGQPLALQPVPDAPDPVTGRRSAVRLVLQLPGVAEMPTYRVMVRYRGRYPRPLGAGEHLLRDSDGTYAEFQGLRRMLLEHSPVQLVPPHPPFYDQGPDPFIYEQYDPGNLPQERAAEVRFQIEGTGSAQGAAVPAVPNTSSAPATAASQAATVQGHEMPVFVKSFTDPRNNPAQTAKYYRQATQLIGLLKGGWGLAMLLTVSALAFAWGAAHALAPGHAKTVVAAYLISQHGTYGHAAILAMIVTLTHTALVVIMGLVIWAYQATHPELGPRVQLWLGTAAGVLVLGMGLNLIRRGIAGGHHQHDHGHDHPHAHGDHEHEGHEHAHHDAHEHAHAHPDEQSWLKRLFTHTHPQVPHAQELTWRLLLVMGISGGIVPCPTAMLIMLMGISAGVVPAALYAVGVFSLGLALTLMAVGFLALSSRRFARRVLSDAQSEGELSGAGRVLLTCVLPALSGTAVAALGAAITAHYVYMLRTGLPLFSWMA